MFSPYNLSFIMCAEYESEHLRNIVNLEHYKLAELGHCRETLYPLSFGRIVEVLLTLARLVPEGTL